MNPRLRHTTLAPVLACAALLFACGDSNDEPAQTTPTPQTIGSGATCRERLGEVVTIPYLRGMGFAVANPDAANKQLSSAIRTVCRRGPANLPLNQGAEQVVAVINQAAPEVQQQPQ